MNGRTRLGSRLGGRPAQVGGRPAQQVRWSYQSTLVCNLRLRPLSSQRYQAAHGEALVLNVALPKGLYPGAIGPVIDDLAMQEPPNMIAWFCLRMVLAAILEEWDDEILPTERFDEINTSLLPIVNRFLTITIWADYASSENDLKQLIGNYARVFQDAAIGGQSAV